MNIFAGKSRRANRLRANTPPLPGSNEELVELRPGRHLGVQTLAGDGKADASVFFCHGAGGNKYQWRHQWQALADAGYRCVAWDFPGHGNSPEQPARADYAGEQLVADCVALFERFAGRRNYLVAHSYGVNIALRALQTLQQRGSTQLDGALLLGAPSPEVTPGGNSRLFSLPPFILELLRPRLAAGFRQLAWHPQADPQLIASEEAAAAKNSMHMFSSLLRQAISPERAGLRQLQLPVVVLAGDHDGLAPAAGAHLLGASLGDAEVHVVADCGHQIMLEKPALTSRHLLALLAGRPD